VPAHEAIHLRQAARIRHHFALGAAQQQRGGADQLEHRAMDTAYSGWV
jgi:hypothetical protein